MPSLSALTIGPLAAFAISHGHDRKLIIAQDERADYFAILDFGPRNDKARTGGQGSTPQEALDQLEANLRFALVEAGASR